MQIGLVKGSLQTSFDVPKLSAQTDREVLRVILQNVLSNSVFHSDEGGHLHATVGSTENELSISVSNTGNQLDAQQAEFGFDPLWRGDDARSETGEHFRLGAHHRQTVHGSARRTSRIERRHIVPYYHNVAGVTVLFRPSDFMFF